MVRLLPGLLTNGKSYYPLATLDPAVKILHEAYYPTLIPGTKLITFVNYLIPGIKLR